MDNLGKWIKERFKTQGALAEELGLQQSRISKWLGGEPIPKTYQDRIRKLGYKGAWPTELPQEASAGASASYLTREEFAEERGALRAEVRLLRESLEKAFELIRDLKTELTAVSRQRGP
jgi:hypothetical protein